MAMEIVGSHYDLTFLNRRVVADAPRKSLAQTFETKEQEVGCAYRFDKALKAFKQIPVVTA